MNKKVDDEDQRNILRILDKQLPTLIRLGYAPVKITPVSIFPNDKEFEMKFNDSSDYILRRKLHNGETIWNLPISKNDSLQGTRRNVSLEGKFIQRHRLKDE